MNAGPLEPGPSTPACQSGRLLPWTAHRSVRQNRSGVALGYCRQLGPDTYLLTYVLREGARITRRATVWRRTETTWQVVYHQGTIVHPG